MSKVPLQTRAYFHFSAPLEYEVFSRSFGDLTLWVAQQFPDSYFVRSDASFSDLKKAFSEAFSTMPEYAHLQVCILKLKENSSPLCLPSGSD